MIKNTRIQKNINNFMRCLLLVGLFIVFPTAQAILVVSKGKLVVDTDTDFFLPTHATGDLCVAVKHGAGFVGNAGPAAACAVGGLLNGGGYLAVSKFPSTVVRQASKTNLLESAHGTWESSGSNIFTRRATHNVSASAFRPGGKAAAESLDPWIFSPTVTTELDLIIKIEDVVLSLGGFGFNGLDTATFSSVGGFGIGSTPGQNILADWDYFIDSSTEGDVSISSFTLFQDTLTLNAGQTYWLTADVLVTAEAVPESSTLALMTLGLLGLGFNRRKRL